VLAHGSSALTRVAMAAGLPVEPARPVTDVLADTTSSATVRVTRREFDAAIETMRAVDLGVRTDVDEGWRTFTLLRTTYEDALLGLAGLTHAPPATWTSDRAYAVGRPRFFGHRPLTVVKPFVPDAG